MKLVRKIIKGPIERIILTKFIGKVLWAPVSVAVLAEGKHDDYLVLNSDPHYELPGGLIKSGENLREAAKREVKEETGFNVELGDLLDIHNHGGITFFFHGKVTDGEKSGSWEGKPEFIKKEEMKEKAWKLEHSHVHDYLFPEEN